MRKFPRFLAIAGLAGCTNVSGYFPQAVTTEVAGRAFFVTPHPHAAGVWGAGPDRPGGAEVLLGGGLALAGANVAAIEQVTGCAVQPASIRTTQTGTTWAAVSC